MILPPEHAALMVLRHGKSAWGDAALDDFERPLKGRGRKDTAAIAELLYEEGLLPELVLCSSARRTRETWEALASSWGDATPECRFVDALYLASAPGIERVLSEEPRDERRVLLIGHNPGLQEFVGGRSGAAVFMKTAHLAILAPEQPAGSLGAARRLALFVRGRDVRKEG